MSTMCSNISEVIGERIRVPEAEDESRYREMVRSLAKGDEIPTDEIRTVMRAALRSGEDLQLHIQRGEIRLRALEEKKRAKGIEAQSQKAIAIHKEAAVALRQFDDEYASGRPALSWEYESTGNTASGLISQYIDIDSAARGQTPIDPTLAVLVATHAANAVMPVVLCCLEIGS